MTSGPEARRYLRRHRYGVLSTLSQTCAGYPFGSVTPFVLDQQAQPVILVSRLAEHTKNIGADPRVSLLVHELAPDIQAGSRLTLVGNASVLADAEGIRRRYLRFFPNAERLLALGDFSFYVITVQRLRFIGGFGDILWLSPGDYAPPAHRLAEAEETLIAHIHQNQNLRACMASLHLRPAAELAMIGIDCDGFDVRADGEILRVDFESEVTTAEEARATLVALANAGCGT
jgi:putative heme iron utilization protein